MNTGPYENILDRLFTGQRIRHRNEDPTVVLTEKVLLTPGQKARKKELIEDTNRIVFDWLAEKKITPTFARLFYAVLNGYGPRKRKVLPEKYPCFDSANFDGPCSKPEEHAYALLRWLDKFSVCVKFRISDRNRTELADYIRDMWPGADEAATREYVPFISEPKADPDKWNIKTLHLPKQQGGIKLNPAASDLIFELKSLYRDGAIPRDAAREIYESLGNVSHFTMRGLHIQAFDQKFTDRKTGREHYREFKDTAESYVRWFEYLNKIKAAYDKLGIENAEPLARAIGTYTRMANDFIAKHSRPIQSRIDNL